MTQRQDTWWTPRIHAERRPFLLARNRIIAAVREHFARQDFVEADCGALQVSPGNEAHLHAFATELIDAEGNRHRRYLHTSPEFACKKLLAAGESRLFSLAHVYRNRERTLTHVPEFTMLEWYRTGNTYSEVIADTVALVRLGAITAGNAVFAHRGRTCDPHAAVKMCSVAEAFQKHANVTLLDTLDAAGTPDRDALARQSPIPVSATDTWSDIFSSILVNCVEPHLGIGAPTVLHEYPACEAALARISQHDPRVADRFEVYACGIELANGFNELTDPVEQRRRLEAEMDLKQRLYGERYPIDEDFLAALTAIPEASGVALGLDRLVMLATGASSVAQVIWTPAN